MTRTFKSEISSNGSPGDRHIGVVNPTHIAEGIDRDEKTTIRDEKHNFHIGNPPSFVAFRVQISVTII